MDQQEEVEEYQKPKRKHKKQALSTVDFLST